MARKLNPDASAADIIRALKESAARAGRQRLEPGARLGDRRRGRGDERRARDRPPRAGVQAQRPHARSARRAASTLKLDRRRQRAGALQPSGVDVYEVYRSANRGAYRRFKRTRKPSLKVKVKPGSVYRWYTIAVDKAGNREAVPAKPDLSMRVDRRALSRAQRATASRFALRPPSPPSLPPAPRARPATRARRATSRSPRRTRRGRASRRSRRAGRSSSARCRT